MVTLVVVVLGVETSKVGVKLVTMEMGVVNVVETDYPLETQY